MITFTKSTVTTEKFLYNFMGLSTDAKPTKLFQGKAIANGSRFFEINTGKLHIFDEEGAKWNLVEGSGGGGGGGETIYVYDLDGDGVPDDVATDQQIGNIVDNLFS